jgi:hypothetical protein
VIVQPGKDGALYMFDAQHMGTMYDRLQIVDHCRGDACRHAPGVIRNFPVVVKVDGRHVVVVPTFMSDDGSNPAGVVATAIRDEPGNPKFEPLWKAPLFDDPEALRRFRRAPSHLAVSKSEEDGERYLWVVDAALPAASRHSRT